MDDAKPLIARKTVAMQVFERLRAMILSGELKGGEKLRQEKLASLLGVSRVPVREAINQLEAEGLVSVETHKGAVVTAFSIEALQEMYELRGLLEPWLLGLAIPKMAQEDFDAAERLLDEMLENEAQVHWSAMNWAFHARLYAPAGRTQSLDFLEKLYVNTYRHFPVPMRFTIGMEAMDAEHRKILRLCRETKIIEAQDFLKDHILCGSVSLLDRIHGTT